MATQEHEAQLIVGDHVDELVEIVPVASISIVVAHAVDLWLAGLDPSFGGYLFLPRPAPVPGR